MHSDDPRRFLRSINIALDLDEPERFRHFRPTSKSVNLIRSVLAPSGDRSLLVVAPYGSGKSLASGYLLHAVQNEPHRYAGGETLLDSVAERIQALDVKLGARLGQRLSGEERGVGASLHGHYRDTGLALREALLRAFSRAGLGREARTLDRIEGTDSEAVAELIEIATGKLEQAGRDHLLIVWDEFGRHLEALSAEGRTGELLALQVLAEAASRARNVRVTLLLLLHRSFLGYAAGLPNSARQEWSKIEGRFRVVQFVDDSLEMHGLLASVVKEIRPHLPPRRYDASVAAQAAQEAGLFEGVPPKDLTTMLEDAWPLEPATLWLLPRVSSRVAQHERTAFSFLHAADFSASVGPWHLFDYFRGDFQSDAGPGGTHKPWLEAESALAKVGPESVEAHALKAAFLLGLGLGGERSRTTRAQLEGSVSGTTHSPLEVRSTVQELISRKLLIHRAQSDQVLVWHGTDVDLRGRLEDERKRIEGSFELAPFLAREAPPPVWRPTRHNADTGVPRYLESKYVSAAGLETALERITLGLREPGTDGMLYYVLPRDPEERETALQLSSSLRDPRVFVVVAHSTETLFSLGVELAGLLRMHHDHELLSQDPMVRQELDLLTDDVRQALRPVIRRVIQPGGGSSDWFHLGRPLEVQGPVGFREALSVIMDEVFPDTPRILSEMVVRRRPTPVIINARKKVVLGILERYGQEALGIEGDFADKAIFRSVFLRTGLYRADQERWRFAAAEELPDPGMASVWQATARFMTIPGSRSVQELVHELLEPPYGVREGLIPLLLAAGLKAFPAPKAVREKASFISDLLPSTIEDIARSPEDFLVDVVDLSPDEEEYLQGVLARFAEWAPTVAPNDDLIRKTFDAVQGWWDALPTAARNASSLSRATRRFRALIAQPDPVAVLLRSLPEEFGSASRDLASTMKGILAAVAELEGMQDRFIASARAALAAALYARGIPAHHDVRRGGQEWARFFPKDLELPALSPVARATLMQLRRSHDSETSLLNALALLVGGRAFKDWDDTTPPEFERKLRASLEDIEHAALEAGSAPDVDDALKEGLIALTRARLRLILQQMSELTGKNAALDLLDDEIHTIWAPVTEES